MRTWRQRIILLSGLLLASCGGWKSGYYSMPYIGERAPADATAETPYHKSQTQELNLPGISLSVNLQNDVQTSDIAWIIIPIHVDLEDKLQYQSQSTYSFCIHIRMYSQRTEATIYPRAAVLTVDGVSTVSVMEIRAGARRSGDRVTAAIPQPIDVDAPSRLAPDTYYNFDICFPGSKPLPDRNIQLDLSRTIQLQGFPPIPKIKFQKAEYRSPYS